MLLMLVMLLMLIRFNKNYHLQHLQHNNIGVIPHTRRQKNEKRYEYIGNQERVGHEAVLNGVHESGDRAE